MKILIAKHSGFCFGVKNAVEIALKNAGENTYTYGEIIHNEHVVSNLEKKGVRVIHDLSLLKEGRVVIRSHGAPKSSYDLIKEKGLQLIDATCPFVKKIHNIVSSFDSETLVLIVGESTHPEVMGIKGWCENAIVVDEDYNFESIQWDKKVAVVAQTTLNPEKFLRITKKVSKLPFKTVEIFDTICYTTIKRQFEAKNLASVCDAVLVIGSKTSSNTRKLFNICNDHCKRCYYVDSVDYLKEINLKSSDTVGIVAGASTPTELIMEVKGYMDRQFDEVQSQEFKDAVEESLVNYKEGKRVKGTVLSADEKGIHVNIGGKKDGLILKEEVNVDGSYNPEDFISGSDVETIIVNKQDPESGCVLLSKRKVDLIKEGDKVVDTIRDGAVFELIAEKTTKGGLLSKLGTYTVFIPASQIRESYVKDLKQFVGKKLRLTAIEIEESENKHKIVASQRKVVEAERKEREEIFWANVQPNVIVNGKVKRVTNFGAFVSIDGFDCLAHIVDLSWTHIKKVEDVLTIGQNYDFLVLSVDREKGRVSLGYKQLQAHPFVAFLEKNPIGAIVKGKVVSIVPFGAFVEVAPDIEGLVHVSEAAHSFVKNINEVVKVGEEVDVMILNADEGARKITLSIKACTPQEEASVSGGQEDNSYERTERKPRKSRSEKSDSDDSDSEWSEDLKNNPFADLLKNLNN